MNPITYNDVKGPGITIPTRIDERVLHAVFFGCWGTFCKSGKVKTLDKKGNRKEKEYGSKDVADALIEYSTQNPIDVLLIGGDNLYDIPIDVSLNGKSAIERQLELGFDECLQNVVFTKKREAYAAFGNHDINTCEDVVEQMNHPGGWNAPSMYYEKQFIVGGDFYVQFLYIDTNLYDAKKPTCSGKVPDVTALKNEQLQWMKDRLRWAKKKRSRSIIVWTFVVGHIPLHCIPHKERNNSSEDIPVRLQSVERDIDQKTRERIEIELRGDIMRLTADYMIHMYLCADEHNTQIIRSFYPLDINQNPQPRRVPVQLICGSGGTVLDDFLEDGFHTRVALYDVLYPSKRMQDDIKSHHGFLSLRIHFNIVYINVYETEANRTKKWNAEDHLKGTFLLTDNGTLLRVSS